MRKFMKGENMSKDYEMNVKTEWKFKTGERFARAHSFDENRTMAIFEDSRGEITIATRNYFDGSWSYLRIQPETAECLFKTPQTAEWLFKTLKEYYDEFKLEGKKK